MIALKPAISRHQLAQWGELIYLMVLKELKVRYKRSFLGYLWAIANPFAYGFVYWIAFKFIMRIDMENYSVFVLTGMFPWAWLSASVTQATQSYTNNAATVRKTSVPKLILPLSNVLNEMTHFVFATPAVLFFVLFTTSLQHPATLLWQYPLMLILQCAFIYPLAVIGGVLNVYVRDVQYLTGLMFSWLFFVTPMVYPLSMVPERFRPYFTLNPAYGLIQSWRDVFAGRLMDPHLVAALVLWAAGFALLASWIYRRKAARIAELV